MSMPTLLCIWTAIGVDPSFQALNDGRLEYVMQIEPGLLTALKSGDSLASEITPSWRGVRRYRIALAQARQNQNARQPAAPASPAAGLPDVALSAQDNQLQALAGGEWEYVVQLKEDHLAALDRGQALVGVIPSDSRQVRRYRMVASRVAQPPSETPRTALPTQPAAPGGESAANPSADAPPTSADQSPARGQAAKPPSIGAPPEARSPAAIKFPEPPESNERKLRTDQLPPPPPLDEERVESSAPEPHQPQPRPESDLPSSDRDADRTPLGTKQPANSSSVSHGPRAAPQTASAPEKAWLPLMLAVCALFASIGGNVYLGWIAWDSRKAYRALLSEEHAT